MLYRNDRETYTEVWISWESAFAPPDPGTPPALSLRTAKSWQEHWRPYVFTYSWVMWNNRCLMSNQTPVIFWMTLSATSTAASAVLKYLIISSHIRCVIKSYCRRTSWGDSLLNVLSQCWLFRLFKQFWETCQLTRTAKYLWEHRTLCWPSVIIIIIIITQPQEKSYSHTRIMPHLCLSLFAQNL